MTIETTEQRLPSPDMGEMFAIVVVDTEKFSRHNTEQQNVIAKLLPEVLETAFRRSGLGEVWQHRTFPDRTGDGMLFGFDYRFLPSVIDGVLDEVQNELARHAPALRANGIRLRLRLGLHIGPATLIDELADDSPVGDTTVIGCRMVDVPALRALLEHSDPDATLLAAAISPRVFEYAVKAGHTRRLGPSRFARTDTSIESKEYRDVSYLYVPVVSGELLQLGLLGVQGHDGARADDANGPQALSAPVESTPVKDGSTTITGGYVQNNAIAGHNVDQSHHNTVRRGGRS